MLSRSVVSTSLWPPDCSPPGSSVHGDSPGKNAGVGCHFFLQGIFPTPGLKPGLPHCRRILHCLSHHGSPIMQSLFNIPASPPELNSEFISNSLRVLSLDSDTRPFGFELHAHCFHTLWDEIFCIGLAQLCPITTRTLLAYWAAQRQLKGKPRSASWLSDQREGSISQTEGKSSDRQVQAPVGSKHHESFCYKKGSHVLFFLRGETCFLPRGILRCRLI